MLELNSDSGENSPSGKCFIPKSRGRYPGDSFVIVTVKCFLLINFANEVINKLRESSPF